MQWKTVKLNLCPSDLQAVKQQHTRLMRQFEENCTLEPDVLMELQAALTAIINQNSDFQCVLDSISQSGADCALRLVHEDPEILNLPWAIAIDRRSGRELGRISHLYLTKCFPEFISPANAPIHPLTAPPLKVLVMISSPEDSDFKKRLSYEEEELEILKAVSPLLRTGEARFDFTDDGSLETLKTKIRNNKYHVLHFFGQVVYKNGEGYLALEDPLNLKTRITTVAEFAAALNGYPEHPIPLVVFTSCQTSPETTAKGLPEIMRQLLGSGIPAALAMGTPVQVRYAAAFSACFYRELAQKQKVPAAFQAALQYLREFENSGALQDSPAINYNLRQWIFPNLYLGAPVGDLVEWGRAPEEVEDNSRRFGFEQNRLVLQPRWEYRFVGRRREKAAILGQFFYRNPVLLRGRSGVGKTALAEHLAQRLMARDPKVHPFVFNEKAHSIQEILDQLKNYLIERGQTGVISTLNHLEKALEKLAFLLARLERVCQPVFIFDNLEAFQSEPGKAFDEKYEDLATVIDFLCHSRKYYLILTSRYPVPEFKNLRGLDLNQVSFNDFWKKVNTLPLYQLQAEGAEESKDSGEELTRLLYRFCGGNYRALELWDRLLAARPEAWSDLWRLPEINRPTISDQTVVPETGAGDRAPEFMMMKMVFTQLLGLLDPDSRLVLELLAQFRIPVQALAVQMQAPEAIADLSGALRHLNDLTLLEILLDRELNVFYYYVPPLVKELLECDDFRDFKAPVRFSPQKAGLYHYHHCEEVRFNLADLETAFTYFYQSTDPQKVNEIGERISGIYFDLSMFPKAFHYCRQVYHLLNQATDNAILNRLGQIFHLDGQYVQAFCYYKKVLSEYQKIGDQNGEATTLSHISNVFFDKGDYDTALTYLEQSLRIRREIGDYCGEAAALGAISRIYDAQRDYDQALEHLRQSLRIREKNGDHSGAGAALSQISRIYAAKGDHVQALDHLLQSLRIRREIEDYSGAGAVMNQISQIYKARGEYDRALDYLEQSLQISREIGDKGGEGATLNNISSIHYTQGDFDTALGYFEQSLRIYQEIGDNRGAGVILNNISQVYHAKGNFDTAMGYLEESLRITEKIGDQSGVGAILNNISRIYQAWGDYNTALDYLKRSLQISREIGDKREMISTFHNLAVVSLEKEEPQKYLEYAVSGYNLAMEIDDAVGIYNVGRILGRMLCKVGMKREGIPILQKCLEIGEAARFPDVGEIVELLNEYQECNIQ